MPSVSRTASAALIFTRLEKEYQETCDLVLQVTEQRELLANSPALRRSIDVRNPYVDPLRAKTGTSKDAYLHAILLSVNGIAAGLRHTGSAVNLTRMGARGRNA